MGKNYILVIQIRLDKPKLGQIMTYLISVLVNFSCQLGQIMTRYDLLEPRIVILSNVRTDSNLI